MVVSIDFTKPFGKLFVIFVTKGYVCILYTLSSVGITWKLKTKSHLYPNIYFTVNIVS